MKPIFQRFFRRFLTLISSSPWYKQALVNCIFILFLFFSPSDKIIYVVSFAHLILMLLTSETPLEALINVYWPWYVFEAGRDFSVILVPLAHIESEVYKSPVAAGFIFSPLVILNVLLLGFVLQKLWSVKKLPGSLASAWFLLGILYLGTRLVSSLLTLYSPVFSFVIFYFQNVGPFVWLVGVALLNKIQQKRFLLISLTTFVTLFCLEFLLSLGQFLKGGFIGIHAERAWYIASFGKGNDEKSSVLRVAGFWSHPNAMANWMFQELVVILLIFNRLYKKNNLINFLTLTGGLVLISLTSLNRTLLVTGLTIPFLFFAEMRLIGRIGWQKVISTNFKLKIALAFVVALGLLFLLYRVGDRVLLSFYSLGENGGISTRYRQYAEAWQLIQMKPLLGHGPEMYAAALFKWLPEGEVRYFPEKVHNSFLLIAAESGLIALVLAIFFLLSIIHKSSPRLDKRIIGVWFFFNTLYMFLQPSSVSVMAVANLFIIILSVATFEVEKNGKKKSY